MRVTIIGPGNMGRGIATRLLSGGHSVSLVGRSREQAEHLASELERHAKSGASIAAAGDPREAVRDSEAVILALWFQNSLEFAQRHAELLSGKVVIDISNPVNESFDGLVTEPDRSAAETIRAALPDSAQVVKAFNTTFAGTVLEGQVGGEQLDVLIAGDDDGAVERVAELARSSGLRPIRVGPLSRARQLEQLGLLGMAMQGPLGTEYDTGWKVVLPGS